MRAGTTTIWWVKVILSRRWRFLSTSVKVFLNFAPDRDLIFWKSRKSSLLCRGCSHKVKFALANEKIAYSYLLIWSLFIQYSCNPLLIKYPPKYVWAAVWLCLCSRCQDSQASLQWGAAPVSHELFITHTSINTHTHTRTHARTHARMHACTHAHTHTHTHTCPGC